jgi:YVTN family beta-propeller protein
MRRRRGQAALWAVSCLTISLLTGDLASGAAGKKARLAAGTLLVLNKAEATASLIDLRSGKVVATIPTREGPHEAAVSPGGRQAVVTNYGSRSAPGSTLTVIDLPTARAVRTIDLGEHRRPHGVAWLPDGRRVAVTAEDSRSLLIVDVAKGEVLRALGTDQDVSHMVALSPDGLRAYVANIGSGSVSVLDLESGKALKTIATGAGAEGIALAPDGSTLWVTNREADSVTVVDTKSLEVLASLPCASFPIRAAATPDGRWILVSNARSAEIAVFDRAARREIRRVKMDLQAADYDGRLFGGRFGSSPVPIGIVIPPDGKRAYVANSNADVVAALDLKTWKVSGLLKAGREPDGMAWSPLATGQRPGS